MVHTLRTFAVTESISKSASSSLIPHHTAAALLRATNRLPVKTALGTMRNGSPLFRSSIICLFSNIFQQHLTVNCTLILWELSEISCEHLQALLKYQQKSQGRGLHFVLMLQTWRWTELLQMLGASDHHWQTRRQSSAWWSPPSLCSCVLVVALSIPNGLQGDYRLICHLRFRLELTL